MNPRKSLFKLNISSFWKNYQGILLIVTVAFLLYARVFKNQFTNWDDDLYVLENPFIKNLSFNLFKQIFSVFYCGNYHPLTLLSLALDYKIGGIQTWPYQFTNLVLHLANIVLVYVFITRLLKTIFAKIDIRYIAIITAGLFAFHPLQVESVAWVSERKNLLYTFFYLFSLLEYVKYSETGKYRLYFWCLGFFVFSLLSKGTAVTLPLCMLVIDYFLGRNLFTKKTLLEKLPFFILSIVFGIIAIYAQDDSSALALQTYTGFTLIDHIFIAAYGWALYIVKLVFPFKLSAFYPYPVKTGNFLPFIIYLIGILSFLITLITLYILRKKRLWIWAFLFLLINISIVIQIIPVGGAIMADRYVYIPSIGFFTAIAYAFYLIKKKSKIGRCSILVLACIYAVFLCAKTWQRVAVWKDSISLWNDVLQHFPENNTHGYLNRASAFYSIGNYPEALKDYTKLLLIEPNNGGAYIGLGLVKKALKDTSGAIKDFNRALELGQKYDGYLNRACIKIDAKEFADAKSDLDSAERYNASRPELFENKGIIFYQTGNYRQALQNYERAILLNPDKGSSYFGRGQAKQALNYKEGAINDYNLSLKLFPSYNCYLNRAFLRYTSNDISGAISDLNNASLINPKGYEAYFDKGYICLNTGDPGGAVKGFTDAIYIEPNDYEAYLNRGIARFQLGKLDEARTDLLKSVTLNPVASAFYFLGLIYSQMGNKSEGCAYFQKAKSMGYEGALEALKKNCE